MFSLVYSSTATPVFAATGLSELLVQCRARNRKLGITGMLVFENGRFLQALEGPEYMVRDLLNVIRRDPRHDAVQVLAEEQIESRQFPDWSMGYSSLGDPESAPLIPYRDVLDAAQRDRPARRSGLRALIDRIRGHS